MWIGGEIYCHIGNLIVLVQVYLCRRCFAEWIQVKIRENFSSDSQAADDLGSGELQQRIRTITENVGAKAWCWEWMGLVSIGCNSKCSSLAWVLKIRVRLCGRLCPAFDLIVNEGLTDRSVK